MQMVLTTNSRMIRGYAIIAKGDEPILVSSDEFKIHSQSGKGYYLVRHGYKVWTCNCPDHFYRGVECKHINAVKFWMKLKGILENKAKEKQVFKPHEDEETKCPFCSSAELIRKGTRKNKHGIKQLFKCKSCNKKFSIDDGFKYMANDPRVITLSLDLYFKGISQNGIVDHLKQFYQVEVSQPTVHRWIRKYLSLISDYTRTLTPDVSGMWAIDEMALKCNGEWNWLWNLMDTDTRFLISSMISEGKTRDVDTARLPMKEAKQVTGITPGILVSDGLNAYQEAVRKEFQMHRKGDDRNTTHIREIAITNKERNNNKIERLHGSMRQRNKVQRGLKNIEPSKDFVEGFKAYYNFIRPHSALNGKTPAQVAGIELGLEGNKWEGLIKQSVKVKR
ncbi:MAG TPA: DDE-type integrase/transposase/recombinase [Methanofastidiosum sp.]|jgi:transposase-like protein|nr:DDE-type integrase/transposase/recombinase [Methanofastidiosum sp.]